MKKIILSVVLFVTTITFSQNNLFSTISTTAQYDEYWGAYDQDGDGVYKISNKRFIVKFKLKFLPSGEGYSIKAVVDEGKSKGHVVQSDDMVEGYARCSGYPYESITRHKYEKHGFVAIGDYVFYVDNVSKDGTSFNGIKNVFIKKGTATPKSTGKKKKKLSFMKRLKALKNKQKPHSYGPAHKALQSQNLDKLITDYLVAMKTKQDGRTSAQKKSDKNVKEAKGKAIDEIKRYNDSIRATPAHKRLKAHQARMKNMDKNTSKKRVTIYNRTGKDIYIYKEGSRNGTRINNNSSTKIDCSSNYTYKFNSNSNGTGSRCYNANSGCGKSVTIK